MKTLFSDFLFVFIIKALMEFCTDLVSHLNALTDRQKIMCVDVNSNTGSQNVFTCFSANFMLCHLK